MSNAYDELKRMLADMRIQQDAADDCAEVAANLVVGRLKHVSSVSTLAKLKRELRDFNLRTHRWKDE